ncbi:MAG TPA: hypothetical protein VFR15_18110 [Chloroflexia bacterium]|nr:hypothetical protein [Chloroflexia bacterium]
MRKTAFITAALLALLAIPALAALGFGAAPAQAKQGQKDTAAKSALGGVSGTVTSVQGGVLTVTTDQNRTVRLSLDSYTVVLKGGLASASALRAGDRVLVNPDFKPIANGTTKAKPATDPRDDKTTTRPSSGSANAGNNGNGNGSAAPPPAGNRGVSPGQANPDDKSVPAGAANRHDPASNSNAAAGSRETAGQALTPARLVWVQQRGETLVYGLVRSVSGGTVVLKTGAQTQATVQVSTSTVYTRQVPQGAASSKNAARTELKQGAHVVVVAAGQSARVVLFITPPANANSNSANANK